MVLDPRSNAENNSNRKTYQKHSRRNLNLTFWSEDRDYIGRGFLVGEPDPATGFVFDIMDEDTFVPE